MLVSDYCFGVWDLLFLLVLLSINWTVDFISVDLRNEDFISFDFRIDLLLLFNLFLKILEIAVLF